jgi:hypothetical protein
MKEIYSPTVGIRNFFRVKMSVNECTANLVFNVEWVNVGTAFVMSRVSLNLFQVCDFHTVSTVQHTNSSAAQ